MNSVIKGTGYILVHTPDMVVNNGSTQTTERIVNPDSDYLKQIGDHLRSYDEVLAYCPNQTYIGNLTPDELASVEFPWYDKTCSVNQRYGPFGEIMPEDEFLLLVQICDEFGLVRLDQDFVSRTREKLAADPIITDHLLARLKPGHDQAEIAANVENEQAEGLYFDGKLVGCVRRAHAIDPNLSAHVLHENIVSKASSTLALLYAVKNSGIDKDEIEYVIDCSETACGDMNQRGGGNFAKATAEMADLTQATGSDTRGFCAAPAHAIIEAAALVKAGVFRAVAVTSGGCTAKLGMNGKDHLKKGVPVLEDVLGGFAVIIAENDQRSPEIVLEYLGRHRIGTGSAPQAVISSLVTDPLDQAGLKVTDVDKFSPEMQNPDITKPAGAGDVPEANFKMIGALAVKRGDLERKELLSFIEKHGLKGYAPTQGHIPSGVPYIGHARQNILDGKMKRVMIIGKGSLFLGRLTNLFDGVSFLIQANGAASEAGGAAAQTGQVSEERIRQLIAETMRQFAAGLLSEEG